MIVGGGKMREDLVRSVGEGRLGRWVGVDPAEWEREREAGLPEGCLMRLRALMSQSGGIRGE